VALTFVGGGARSGKSRYALDLALRVAGRRAFVATAEAFDEEMRVRIEKHKGERSAGFETVEVPLELHSVFAGGFDVYLVDCLTLWCSNLMLAGRDVEREVDGFLQAAALARASSEIILVTNEVGCGIVPENELARRFRDRCPEPDRRLHREHA